MPDLSERMQQIQASVDDERALRWLLRDVRRDPDLTAKEQDIVANRIWFYLRRWTQYLWG